MPVSEAQKKASVKYLEKLDEIRIRMPKGKKEIIQTAAAAVGESVNGYINGAIDARMAQEAAGGPQRAGVVSLPSESAKVAREAAESAGEVFSAGAADRGKKKKTPGKKSEA